MKAFTPAPLPSDESQRLQTLASYAVLDTAPELAFDDFPHLASRLLDVPIALISLVLSFVATIYPSWRASRVA